MKYYKLIGCALFTLLFHLTTYGLTITLYPLDASCGNNTGSITAEVFGGVAPYAFLWSDGQTTATANGLLPGTYTVTVTDANSDTDSATATIANTPQLTGICPSFIVPGQGNPQIAGPCNDQCNGTLYLNVESINGAQPLTMYTTMGHVIGSYGPNSIPTIENLCSDDVFDTYVTDAYGCTGMACAFVSSPPNSFAYTAQILPACSGQANGQIDLSFINAPGVDFNANWTGPTPGSAGFFMFNVSLPNLLPGAYAITIVNTQTLVTCDTIINIIVPDAGASCGIISGKVYVDTLSNCLADINEPLVPFRLIRFTPGPYYATTDSQGNYTANIPYGTYNAETISDSIITNVCSVSGINLNAGTSPITGIDLGDSCAANPDLSIYLAGGVARPGFTYGLYMQVKNNSFSTINSPAVTLDHDPNLTIVSATFPYTVTGPSQLTISMSPLPGFGIVSGTFTFTVAPNPALIGTVMSNTATVDANQPEPDLSNNTFTLQQPFSGSYDPNDKSVWPAHDPLHYYFVDIDSLLQYTIRFQNTGNDTAFNIMLVDTLNEYLEITSFEMTGSSHPCTWEITGQNILKVHYENILLVDSITNEPASHGLFSFMMTHTPSLQTVLMPYTLENVAAIYFDFNPPVITNAAFSTIDFSVGLPEYNNNGVTIRPNPTHDNITISSINQKSIDLIRITDLTGREITRKINAASSTIIDLSGFVPGIYFVITESESGIRTSKLIIN